jgi:predicted Zn-ribbon and HTH transcriptional regulator
MTEYKQCSYSFRKAIKQAKRQYRDKVESQFKGSDTRGMWQGLQSITYYKRKTSLFANHDVLLPDKLNNFFARLEDNTVPLTRPATKTCGLSFTAAKVSKTFKCVNPCKAAGPDGIAAAPSEHVQTSWLVCLRTYSIYPYPGLLFPHSSSGTPLFLFPRKLR